MEFSRELSAMVARTPDGESRAWPVVHTIQVDGVCDEVIAPALDIPLEVAAAAENAALRIASELGVTGVMAVELFETPGRGRRLPDQRARHAPAQHRALDPGRLGDEPVRAAPPGHPEPAARRHGLAGPRRRDEELPRRRQPGPVFRLPGRPRQRTGREGALLRQGRPAGPEDRPRQPRRDLSRRRRLRPATGHHRGRHHPERPGAMPARRTATSEENA